MNNYNPNYKLTDCILRGRKQLFIWVKKTLLLSLVPCSCASLVAQVGKGNPDKTNHDSTYVPESWRSIKWWQGQIMQEYRADVIINKDYMGWKDQGEKFPCSHTTVKTLAKIQQNTFKIKVVLKCFAGLGSKYAFVSLRVKLIKEHDLLLSFANQVRAYHSVGQLCYFLGRYMKWKRSSVLYVLPPSEDR